MGRHALQEGRLIQMGPGAREGWRWRAAGPGTCSGVRVGSVWEWEDQQGWDAGNSQEPGSHLLCPAGAPALRPVMKGH